eukprot:3779693-Lingulodinium_polyedra.AAC.1
MTKVESGHSCNIEFEEAQRLFFFGLAGKPVFTLPQRTMQIETFLHWCGERHSQQGLRLAKFNPKCEFIDWESAVG